MIHKYGMKISKNKNIHNIISKYTNGNGIFITDETINKVKRKRIYVDNSINKHIQNWHKHILFISKNRVDKYPHGEVGILSIITDNIDIINSNDPYIQRLLSGIVILGDYNNINAGSNTDYIKALSIIKDSELIFMHSHPNGDTFSYTDINTFINTPTLGVLTVIGNNGNIYVLSKEYDFNEQNSRNFITSQVTKGLVEGFNIDKAKYEAAKNFLNNSSTFGITYIHD